MFPELYDNTEIAKAAGMVNIFWGRLESNLGDLLIQYAKIDDTTTAQIILSELDIRSRMNLCKAFSIVQDHPTVATLVERCIGLIDNKIRTARNDIAHGYYEFEPNLKIYRPKITKVKTPFNPSKIEMQAPLEIGERELWGVINSIESTGVFLNNLHQIRTTPLLTPIDPDFDMQKAQLSYLLDVATDAIAAYTR